MSEVPQNVIDKISELIEERLGIQVPSPETDLIDAGLLDSLALVNLIVVLEDAFACEMPMEDFDIAWFRSVRSIAEYLDGAGVLETRGSL